MFSNFIWLVSSLVIVRDVELPYLILRKLLAFR